MNEVQNLHDDILLSRRELKNIRQEVRKLQTKQNQEAESIKLLLTAKLDDRDKKEIPGKDQDKNGFNMVPIGFISSCFKNKNGIPRQPSLCQSSKASLEINKTFFTNPEHSLIGLNEFSCIWILFVFHKNKESSVKAKVHPPRMNGTSVGVFSTRSPHRPCAIGLSLTTLEKIIGNTLFLSGVDLLDGTPVLDIKPYIPSYDTPQLRQVTTPEEALSEESKHTNSKEAASPNPVTEKSKDEILSVYHKKRDPERKDGDIFQTDTSINSVSKMLTISSHPLEVLFTERASKDLEKFHPSNHNEKCEYCLDFINGFSEAKQAIIEILQNDPRSVYRKNKCSDKLYFFEIDKLHVTCWFDDIIAEVLRVKPSSKCNIN